MKHVVHNVIFVVGLVTTARYVSKKCGQLMAPVLSIFIEKLTDGMVEVIIDETKNSKDKK